MTSPRPHLIVNPTSASGRTGRSFDRIARALRREVGDFDAAYTRYPGHATELAREAVAAGSRLVVAVGGDGTVSEVADGLAIAGDGGVTLAIIPFGTGGDLRKTLGQDGDPATAARVIAAGVDKACDLGHVEFVGPAGASRSRHFVNECGCGISAGVVQQVARIHRFASGRIAYLLGAASALVGWRDQRVRWRADGGPWRDSAITCFSVCNGRYFGGGMMVAPDARLDDGLFDVTMWSGLGFADLLLKRPMLYDGTHVRLPNTTRIRARTVDLEPAGDEPVLLELDGDQPGTLPARITILPGALRVRVAPGT